MVDKEELEWYMTYLRNTMMIQKEILSQSQDNKNIQL
jgi:hypothetical protein